jgi:DNA polymerase III subunit beta
MIATDLQEEVSATMVGTVDETGEFALPCHRLSDICHLPGDEDVTVKVSGGRAYTTRGKRRFVLSTLPGCDFPVMGDLANPQKITVAAQDLKSLLSRVTPLMAKNDVRFYLCGASLEISQSRITATATNGFSLAIAYTQIDGGPESSVSAIIPRESVLEMVRGLGKEDYDVDLYLDDKTVRLVVGPVSLVSRLIIGNFPDVTRVIPRNNPNVVRVNKSALMDALHTVDVCMHEKLRTVSMSVEDATMKITGSTIEGETSEDTVDIEHEGDSLEVTLNMEYISNVLSAIPSDVVQIELDTANSGILIRSADVGREEYVVMPVRR